MVTVGDSDGGRGQGRSHGQGDFNFMHEAKPPFETNAARSGKSYFIEYKRNNYKEGWQSRKRSKPIDDMALHARFSAMNIS